ncbi:hypothetical protein [Spiroplasma endosymbiont of Lonchoptera lutea]|uniref:hypothetical protein n=1 Tax=Spiroplasma endosymbiont of Lonchoptera lutea TaxID=3066297 RepID=UPI0030D40036
MYKFISWLVIAFIGLVPLGAFFDTKKPSKPNMEQFFMKREKRAANPNQCGNSCELKFASLKNTKLIHHGDYWLDISESGFTWPSDVELEYPNWFRLFGYKNWISAFNFYKKKWNITIF